MSNEKHNQDSRRGAQATQADVLHLRLEMAKTQQHERARRACQSEQRAILSSIRKNSETSSPITPNHATLGVTTKYYYHI